MIGDHQRDSHSAGRSISRPAYLASSGSFDSYQCGRSHRAVSRNTAPSSLARSYSGPVRSGRSDSYCSAGWTMPYILLNDSAARARANPVVREDG